MYLSFGYLLLLLFFFLFSYLPKKYFIYNNKFARSSFGNFVLHFQAFQQKFVLACMSSPKLAICITCIFVCMRVVLAAVTQKRKNAFRWTIHAGSARWCCLLELFVCHSEHCCSLSVATAVVLVFVAAVADECSLLHSLLALSGHGAVVYIEVH